MGVSRKAKPVKLFAGLLGSDEDLLRRARHLMTQHYGMTDIESEIWPFTLTDYYELEMGPNLRRWFISFDQLVMPDQLASIKNDTNALEREIADACLTPGLARPVNIDPGYIDLGKLVLATTKDRAHRIYLGHGVFAEITLQFVRGEWIPQEQTYPDYRLPEYHAFFTRARDVLHEQRQTQFERAADRDLRS